jgi:[protein-PII] uridylyltransferase
MPNTESTVATEPTPGTRLREERRRLLGKIDRLPAHGFIRNHSAAMDDYFLTSFTRSAVGPQLGDLRNPYALIALGGYGRAEQCVFSDIDLLFLFESKVPPEAEGLVREIVYPLWDAGLEVGHATRSINESIRLARQDYEVLTALLDGRFVCGASPLFHTLMERLRTKLITAKSGPIVEWLIASNQKRHERFGDGAYLLEPNLKEGQGGLRDYHTMLWIARILADIKQPRDLEYHGYLSHGEFRSLETALGFVWNLRNHLHRLLGRKCDQLHMEHQAKLAEAMNIKGAEGLLPVEKLLGDLHGHMEFIKQCYRVFIYELDQKKRMVRKNKHLKQTDVPGLKFNRGMLNFVSPEAIVRHPELLVRIFVESTAHRAPLNAEARRLVREFSHLVGEGTFRNARKVVGFFEKVLIASAVPFDALNAMFDTGFLLEFIPEMRRVVNRIQFDQYHLYPVARHLLLTVGKLKEVVAAGSEEPDRIAGRLYRDIRHKRALFWAALLHDIGKGHAPGTHAEKGAQIAEGILQKKGLPPSDIETVVFLVREHLLLFETASRRDINDEETALFVARRVGKTERLKMLYLLSVADAMATGPKAWNDWTASLMRTLFLKTLNVMEQGELVSRRAVRTIEEKKERILAEARSESARALDEKLLEAMSPRYLLYTPSQDIPRHMTLFHKLGDNRFAYSIAASPDGRTRRLTLCAHDRPGLLSKIAGALTLNSINILDVHIFTWRNKTALDIFELQPPLDPLFEEERWQRFAEDLNRALADELDLSAALTSKKNGFKSIKPFTKQRPQKVVIDNETSSFFTIVEVIAWDFPGLLYRIADALYRCKLDIRVAKSGTRVDQVVDVFYVRNFDGEKIDRPEEVERVKETIEAVLQ